jgi:hypothetical protein
VTQAGTGIAKVALIALIAVGSIFLWIGIPVGWPRRMPWRRSLRGEEEGRAPRQILDVVMVISMMSAGFVSTPRSHGQPPAASS